MTTIRTPQTRRGPYARGRQSQELILNSALEIIGRKGYSGTLLSDIAADVGMTQAGILHHFGTKENLLLEVLRQRDVVDERSLQPDLRGLPRIVLYARHNIKVPGLIQLYVILAAAAADPGHPAHEFFRQRDERVFAAIRDDIRERQIAGTFNPDADAEVTARALFALSDGLQAEWLVNPTIDLAGTIEWFWNTHASPADT